MRTKCFLFLSVVTLLFSTSCHKKETEENPVADFSFDKAEYVEGETITVTSKSSNASSEKWILPDGQTVNGSSASFAIQTLSVDRILQFRLEVVSKSGEKADFMIKNVQVKTAKGKISFYTNYFKSATSIHVQAIPG